MLMALLYREDDEVVAAALACEQIPYGDSYWNEIFAGHIDNDPALETAYITINNADLRRRLLLLGFDDQIDGQALAREIASKLRYEYVSERLA